jgi:Rrf2 family cysteine metabolism transcriptional repressor
MKLSTRARYGTRALLDLAIHNDRGPVLLKDIAERQEISLTYLEHLIAPLIAAGIVKSTRGPRGGIRLARPPRDISLIEVVRIFEGSTAPVECVDCPEVCHRAGSCATRDVWSELEKAVNTVLETTSLQDLMERQEKKSLLVTK